jgi:hypothetical protein
VTLRKGGKRKKEEKDIYRFLSHASSNHENW